MRALGGSARHMSKVVFSVCLLLLSSFTLAQTKTKMSGTLKCGKDTIEHMIPVGDHPNHSLGMSQGNCTWTKPWKIAGLTAKDGMATGTVDADGDVAHTRGIYVDTMENGDKAVYHIRATVITKNGQAQITGHKWHLIEGTGKLKGFKGQGACKVTLNPDDSADYQCTGAYTVPK